jgi:hypothetical protein
MSRRIRGSRGFRGDQLQLSAHGMQVSCADVRKSGRIFALANVSVKQNPSPARDFNRIAKKSAYDSQKLAQRFVATICDLKKSSGR